MNMFTIPKGEIPQEITSVLLDNKNVRIERIISNGHTTDWYNQNEDERVCLLEGEADLEFEGEIITLAKGDIIYITKHQKHRVAKTTKCIWLCVFIV